MSTFRSQPGKTVIRMDILPPEISGPARRANQRRGEVVDAQFITVDGASSRARRRSHNDNLRENLRKTAAARDARITVPQRVIAVGERALMRLSADAFSAVVAMVFVLIFGFSGGFSFLFAGTQTADAGQPLGISHVTMTSQDANGMRVLLINGIIENRGSDALSMPAIRADLLSGEDLLATTLISPPASAIAAGHSRGFSARVPQPGGKLPDLRLSFADEGA